MKVLAATIACVGLWAWGSGVARADDKAECIGAFDAGQELRKDGKLTQALVKFSVCARAVCPASLQKACVDSASTTAAARPTVLLSATDAAHHDLTDATVTLDGAPLAAGIDGKPLLLDPGVHTFRFEKSGLPPVERQVVVKEGQQSQPVAVVLGDIPWSTLKKVGLGIGVAGVAGIAVGGIFGGLAVGQYNTAKTATTLGPFNNAESSGKTYATVSTAGFVAGGVLAAAGVILFVVAPAPGSSASAAIAPTPGGLSVAGTF
jgi:hypothetical protein